MAREGGLILGIVVGIAALVISVIIAFIIVSTIADVETDTASPIGFFVVEGEADAWLNDTPYTLGKAGEIGFTNPRITAMINTTSGLFIALANASVTDAGVLTNGTTLNNGYRDITLNYTYSRKGTSISAKDLRYNFTKGVDNISEKIPTILLIAAVVLVLGILALLWAQYQKMNIGGSGGGL